MLEFAVEYKAAIRAIAGDVKLELTAYELSAVEWQIATQLRDVLQVSVTPLTLFQVPPSLCAFTDFNCATGTQRRYRILLSQATHFVYGDPSNGSPRQSLCNQLS